MAILLRISFQAFTHIVQRHVLLKPNKIIWYWQKQWVPLCWSTCYLGCVGMVDRKNRKKRPLTRGVNEIYVHSELMEFNDDKDDKYSYLPR